MTASALPLTYDECRARFRWAAHRAGVRPMAHPIDATGPEGQRLTLDVAVLGSARPERGLVVLSGVHGVEGFIGSALQCDLLGRLDPSHLAEGLRVVLVHAVNPWGMAWWRRQNESNVDLNRNWDRQGIEPPRNEGYLELYDLLCPDTDSLPTPQSFLDPALELVEDRGLPWMRDAISVGQCTHAGRAEHWVHRHRDRLDPKWAEVILDQRRCYTPDDAEWAADALQQGRLVLDTALVAVADPG